MLFVHFKVKHNPIVCLYHLYSSHLGDYAESYMIIFTFGSHYSVEPELAILKHDIYVSQTEAFDFKLF